MSDPPSSGDYGEGEGRTLANSLAMTVDPDRGGQSVRVRVTATERLGDDQTSVCYEIRLSGERPPIAGRLSLPFPSGMSLLDAELRMAVREAVVNARLPPQLAEVFAFD